MKFVWLLFYILALIITVVVANIDADVNKTTTEDPSAPAVHNYIITSVDRCQEGYKMLNGKCRKVQ